MRVTVRDAPPRVSHPFRTIRTVTDTPVPAPPKPRPPTAAETTEVVERLRAELPAGLEPTGEPLGWTCERGCGGRLALSEIRQATAAVDLLLDAARSHRC